MAIDYKKELEAAAKGMIFIHEPSMLIKMIARTIVQKVNVRHVGILLHQPETDTYVLNVSRGQLGMKIPAGFARVDKDSALIRLFLEYRNYKLIAGGFLVYSAASRALKKRLNSEFKQVVKWAMYQMEMFDVIACVPSFYRNQLLGVLLLGRKINGSVFLNKELDFFSALASDVAMAIRNAQLFKDLELELKRKRELFINTTYALAAAIDAKDHYTHGHTRRVTSLSLQIYKKFCYNNGIKVDSLVLEHLEIAALLHDIGKIGVPEPILNKNGPLDEQEKSIMEGHPLVGADILQPIKELNEAVLGVKYHHERYDGSGYPGQLKGDQIPLIASIISVADAFDAMTTDRPYRKGLSKQEAIEEVKRMSGRQFNPKVVDAFAQIDSLSQLLRDSGAPVESNVLIPQDK